MQGFNDERVRAALRYLYMVKPWWSRFGSRMTIVPIDEPPQDISGKWARTTSTDPGFRLYVDRTFASAAPFHVLAASLEHEFQHHSRDSWRRLSWLDVDEWKRYANICFDLEINSAIDLEFRSMNMDQIASMCAESTLFTLRDLERWGVTAPPGIDGHGWLPSHIGLPEGLPAEEYLKLIRDSSSQEAPKEESDSKTSDGDSREETNAQESLSDSTETPTGDKENSSTDSDSDSDSDSEKSDTEEKSEPDKQPTSDGTQNNESSSDDPGQEDTQESDLGPLEGSGSDTGVEREPSDQMSPQNASSAPSGLATESNGNITISDREKYLEGMENCESSTSQPGYADEVQGKGSGGSPAEVSLNQSREDSPTRSGPPGEPPALQEERSTQTPESLSAIIDQLRKSDECSPWVGELGNPSDPLDSPPWSKESEAAEPVDRGAIDQAFQELEADIIQAQITPTDFGISPGHNLVNWAAKRRRGRGLDWQSRFSKLVSASYDSVKIRGASDLSYSTRNPNQQKFGPILPGLHDYAPSIYVIQDVSYSMLHNDAMSISLELFSDLCNKVLGRFQSDVTWITVDSRVVDVGTTRAWNPDTAKRWKYGYGGTVISPTIRDVMSGKFRYKKKRYPAPDLLIVVTDCAFRWPEMRPARRSKILIAAISTPEDAENWLPSWVQWKREVVVINPKETASL